jgi:hypothetical protein
VRPNGALDKSSDLDNEEEEGSTDEPVFENWEDDPELDGSHREGASGESLGIGPQTAGNDPTLNGTIPDASFDQPQVSPKPPPNPASVKWQYVDDNGAFQGWYIIISNILF